MSQRSSSPSDSPGQSQESINKSRIEDLTRMLSVSGNSEGEMLRSLRGMNLGDDFWIYGFKVTPCTKSYSHKWSFCPCGHVGETGRRRDPRVVPYKPDLCPLAKAKRACPLGDNCLWAHNVFEHWLHPAKYKTRLCTFGPKCNRSICFFAHSPDELRVVPSAGGHDDDDDIPVPNFHKVARKSMPQMNFSSCEPLGPKQQQQQHQHGLPRMLRTNSAHIRTAPNSATPLGFSSSLLTAPQLHLGGANSLDAETSALLLGLPLLGMTPATRGGRRATEPYGDINTYDTMTPYGGSSIDFFMGANSMHGMDHNPNGQWNPAHALNNQLPPFTQSAHPVRFSDPGTMVLPGLLNPNISPVQLLDRISEGGQNKNSSNSQCDYDHDMEAVLASIVSSHQSPTGNLAQQKIADAAASNPQTPAFTSPTTSTGALPGSRWSTPGGGSLHHSSSSHEMQQEQQQQTQQQVQDMLPELIMMMQHQQQLTNGQRTSNQPVSFSNSSHEVDNLVAKLQDHGLGNTKEELVASLSSLLTQLLSVE